MLERTPQNAEWQRTLAILHGRVGTAQAAQKKYEHAHEAFSRGRDMISALSEPTRASERLRLDLDWFNAQIAALET